MPVFVINPHTGLLVRGNIDLTARPVVKNRDGSISTVRSVSFHLDNFQNRPKGAEVLVPTVIGDRVVSNQSAWSHYKRTRSHLGIFDTPAHATSYAIALHKWQANYYLKKIRR